MLLDCKLQATTHSYDKTAFSFIGKENATCLLFLICIHLFMDGKRRAGREKDEERYERTEKGQKQATD